VGSRQNSGFCKGMGRCCDGRGREPQLSGGNSLRRRPGDVQLGAFSVLNRPEGPSGGRAADYEQRLCGVEYSELGSRRLVSGGETKNGGLKLEKGLVTEKRRAWPCRGHKMPTRGRVLDRQRGQAGFAGGFNSPSLGSVRCAWWCVIDRSWPTDPDCRNVLAISVEEKEKEVALCLFLCI